MRVPVLAYSIGGRLVSARDFTQSWILWPTCNTTNTIIAVTLRYNWVPSFHPGLKFLEVNGRAWFGAPFDPAYPPPSTFDSVGTRAYGPENATRYSRVLGGLEPIAFRDSNPCFPIFSFAVGCHTVYERKMAPRKFHHYDGCSRFGVEPLCLLC